MAETLSIHNKQSVLKAIREKPQFTDMGKPIIITAEFSMGSLNAEEPRAMHPKS